jgi:glycerol uptake facilitator protein
MQNFWAELIGTMILIIMGDGVVANVVLAKTKGNNAGWIVITTGWALAVTLGVYAVGRISGAHLNPAVTLAMAAIGTTPWADVPMFIGAQMIGAFIGAVVVYLSYLPHWKETKEPGDKLAVFCTGPAVRSPIANLITEFVGTWVLVFAISAIGANFSEGNDGAIGNLDLASAFSTGIAPLLVGVTVFSIGLSLGGPTGYAINPARDLGPRIAHAVLPIPGKGGSDWEYAWIPVVGPILGGIAGAFCFQWANGMWQ